MGKEMIIVLGGGRWEFEKSSNCLMGDKSVSKWVFSYVLVEVGKVSKLSLVRAVALRNSQRGKIL